jgi:hypothetical protein
MSDDQLEGAFDVFRGEAIGGDVLDIAAWLLVSNKLEVCHSRSPQTCSNAIARVT